MSNDDDPENWSDEKLRRKEDQAWECAGGARQDGDADDEKRWTDLARKYREIRKSRV